TIEDHMTCQEVSSGRYAAECDDGYYYDEASYSCVEDTLSQCSSYIDGHRMCVLPDDGSTAPSLGCRSVWYGDECDDMYSVHLADLALRKEVCSLLTSGDGLCDVSAFDFAATSFDLSINDAADITSLIGLSDCLNVSSVSLSSLSVTSVSVLTSLRQVVAMSLIALDTRTSMIDSTAVLSLSPLQSLSRLQTVSVYDNKHLFDVSVLYRNISLSALYISDTETGEYIPLCRSEDDETYWTYISTVYPVHESDSSLKARQFLATSCPLNSYGTFSCDVTESLSCPSIILNEVYNTSSEEKQCASIAKTSGSVSNGDLTCYTVHDDNVRRYLINECLPDGNGDLDSGIISVATMRSKLSCPLDIKNNESFS
ncbi:hypothetical protein ADUPG1_011692, partial [Aduncisulcus paluster]